MKSEWKKVKVKDILYTTDFVANGSFASLKENVTYRDYPDYAVMIRLVDYNRGWKGNFIYLDKDSYDFLKKSFVEPKDIIISNVGANVGTVFQAPELNIPMTLGPNSILLKPNNINVDRNYIYYFFISKIGQAKIREIVSGSAQPKFNKTDFRNINIELPSLPIQKKIAHILSTLDNKIELNRKMNETLEAMAQAFFKSWFVDFDPVHAKMECKNDKELEKAANKLGISKEILDLFPNEFEESEMGMIPKGWSYDILGSICKVQSGYAFKGIWWQNIGIKVIKIKNINGTEIDTNNCQCVSREIANKHNKFKLNHGDCLIAMTGATVGKVGIIDTSREEFLLNQRVGRFQPMEYCSEYIKTLVKTEKFFDAIQSEAQGSAQPNISANGIESIKITKPSIDVMKAFSVVLQPIYSKMLLHQSETTVLQQTRNTLLPKLLSGKLDVSKKDITCKNSL